MSTARDDTRRGRIATRGAFLGFLIDNFDIYLPVIVLAPALPYFIPPTLGAGTTALIASWIFVATLVARPVGSLIFGVLGDAIGRRRATLIAVSGFGVVTLLIGCLPGFGSWGWGGIVALIALRFVDGIFLGGEYSGANVLAMEETPIRQRGAAGGFIQTGATAAFVLTAVLTLGVFQLAPPGGPDSAYSQWGWRIPFFVGAVLAGGFVVYYRRRVPESSVWQKAPTARLSALSLVRGRAALVFLQVFVLMTGLWFLLNSVTALVPGVLAKQAGLTPTQVTIALIVLYSVVTVWFPIGGRISQRFGRRSYLVGTGAVALVAGVPVYALLIGTPAGDFGRAMTVAAFTGVLVIAPWAVVAPYLCERFRTESRAAGFGLGYSLAVVIPAFYASYQLWLAHLVPPRFTVLVLVGIGSILVIGAALAGPETKDVDFAAQNHAPPLSGSAAEPTLTYEDRKVQ